MLIYDRLCRTMKPIWINKVREKQDKSGGIVPPPEIPTMKSQGAAKNEANNAAKAEPIAAKVVVPVEEAAAPAKVEIDFSNVEVEPLFEEMVDFDTFSK